MGATVHVTTKQVEDRLLLWLRGSCVGKKVKQFREISDRISICNDYLLHWALKGVSLMLAN